MAAAGISFLLVVSQVTWSLAVRDLDRPSALEATVENERQECAQLRGQWITSSKKMNNVSAIVKKAEVVLQNPGGGSCQFYSMGAAEKIQRTSSIPAEDLNATEIRDLRSKVVAWAQDCHADQVETMRVNNMIDNRGDWVKGMRTKDWGDQLTMMCMSEIWGLQTLVLDLGAKSILGYYPDDVFFCAPRWALTLEHEHYQVAVLSDDEAFGLWKNLVGTAKDGTGLLLEGDVCPHVELHMYGKPTETQVSRFADNDAEGGVWALAS